MLPGRAEYEHSHFTPTVELLELAGADLEVAGATLDWLRQRERGLGKSGPFETPGISDR